MAHSRITTKINGFSILEVLFATMITAITASGIIYNLRGIEVTQDKEKELLALEHDLTNLIEIINSHPDEFKTTPVQPTSCQSKVGTLAQFNAWCNAINSRQALEAKIKLYVQPQGEYSSQPVSILLEAPTFGQLSVLLPPPTLEFPQEDGSSQNLPDRGYRIKWWDSRTAERFKGRYFGAPAAPQYKIFRTWFKREMIEETNRLQPKYEDGSTLFVYTGSRDGFTIICDPNIGPCAKYEAGPELIEYISKGQCGGACM